MKNLFVSFEIAKLLKEKGFNEDCLGFYSEKYSYSNKTFPVKLYISEGHNETTVIKKVEKLCSAPLYQQVTDWFREKHSLIITILPHYREKDFVGYCIDDSLSGCMKLNQELKADYYLVLNEAIKEAIKLI